MSKLILPPTTEYINIEAVLRNERIYRYVALFKTLKQRKKQWKI